jgi:hypothetical protein
MSVARRIVAAMISLIILAASIVLGLGVLLWTFAATDLLWTFAATDSRWIASAVSVLVAWIVYMAIEVPFILWWTRWGRK